MPSSFYDYEADVSSGKRPFLLAWLKQYDWLCYSTVSKGALCKFCVLFEPPPPLDKGGVNGAFIKTAFSKYKNFHEQSKCHVKSASVQRANDLISIINGKKTDVYQMVNSSVRKTIESNKDKLKSIVSSVIFLGKHGLPFRGTNDDTAVFNNLLNFRVESGDVKLENHLKKGPKNATYISHRMQNTIISNLGSVMSNIILKRVKNAECYSVLADETMDVKGVEQLSICLRYVFYENSQPVLKEDFVGFIALDKLDAESIAYKILSSLESWGLDLNK